MANLWILKGAPAFVQNSNQVQVHEIPVAALPVQKLAVTGTSANAEVTGGSVFQGYRLITLVADADMHIEIGSTDSVAATADSLLLPGGAYFSFAANVGEPAGDLYIAAITA